MPLPTATATTDDAPTGLPFSTYSVAPSSDHARLLAENAPIAVVSVAFVAGTPAAVMANPPPPSTSCVKPAASRAWTERDWPLKDAKTTLPVPGCTETACPK